MRLFNVEKVNLMNEWASCDLNENRARRKQAISIMLSPPVIDSYITALIAMSVCMYVCMLICNLLIQLVVCSFPSWIDFYMGSNMDPKSKIVWFNNREVNNIDFIALFTPPIVDFRVAHTHTDIHKPQSKIIQRIAYVFWQNTGMLVFLFMCVNACGTRILCGWLGLLSSIALIQLIPFFLSLSRAAVSRTARNRHWKSTFFYICHIYYKHI